MYKLKRLVVGLDLSPLDETVIEYTSMVARLLNVDKIYFNHVAKNLELPKDVIEKYPDLLAPVDEGIELKISNKVKKYFDKDFFEQKIEVIVSEGNPFHRLLKLVKVKEADLLIMGLKNAKSKEEGLLPRKLTNLSPCSVLLVPEVTKPVISKVTVPIDFSKYSHLALQMALSVSEKADKKPEVSCQHIYEVPSGYHSTGKSFEDFSKIMEKNSLEHFERFLKKYKVKENIKCDFELNKKGPVAKVIQKTATEHGSDLIVVGSKGRTEAAAVLLGSIAEKLINYDQEIPLLIVKEKGENLTFIEALLRV